VLEDGEKAVRFFENTVDAPALCPDLVLLDLNLPRFRGKYVLSRIRASRCARVPVLIVTSSDSSDDREDMERYGAAAYFRKPSDLAEFMKLGDVVRDLLSPGGV
jgi:DNA-binding response OmpR family regulator